MSAGPIRIMAFHTEPDREGTPRQLHRIQNRHHLHQSVTRFLREHVPHRESKREVSAPTLWTVLRSDAAGVASIHADNGRLDGLPTEESIR